MIRQAGSLALFEVPAPDLDAAATFYARVFGWQPDPTFDFGGHLAFRHASGKLLGFYAGHIDVTRAGILLYIAVDDVDAALAAVRGAGGRLVKDKMLIDERFGWLASFRDPAGNVMALLEAPRR